MFVTVSTPTVDHGCPPDFTYINTTDPPCFWMSDVIGFHHEAAKTCASLGGSLANLKDESTFKKIKYEVFSMARVR